MFVSEHKSCLYIHIHTRNKRKNINKRERESIIHTFTKIRGIYAIGANSKAKRVHIIWLLLLLLFALLIKCYAFKPLRRRHEKLGKQKIRGRIRNSLSFSFVRLPESVPHSAITIIAHTNIDICIEHTFTHKHAYT